jgi:hypothetical protein
MGGAIIDRAAYVLGGGFCCVSFLLFAVIVWVLVAQRKRKP